MKLIMELEYDQPDDPYWMNPDNLAWLLGKYTAMKNIRVNWAENGDPWRRPESKIFLRPRPRLEPKRRIEIDGD